ncbi:multidrug efflux transporter AcrB transmembrane domain-containing protein [Cystobasidium minutum MCA 4210]|uniref:multidrug efflux transporter AcrB transmembrane domain-containing protein n=1 Tax=Cystobasidium minutum MCA 4210 TaxID=1397322 RepID=UPI0034CDD217|eukprot:jgi/Rhomi1/192321/gm1.535_g
MQRHKADKKWWRNEGDSPCSLVVILVSLSGLLSYHQVNAGNSLPLNDDDNAGLVTDTTASFASDRTNDTKPAPTPPDLSIHKEGWCAFGQDGTSCGSKSFIPLPCASPSPAKPIVSESLRQSLASVCNITDYTHSCCDETALGRLQDSLAQASAFIALCPACADSFRRYYCEFTCSPNQSTFINITSTQQLLTSSSLSQDGDAANTTKPEAIKSIDFYVNPKFGKAFYEACKNVKFAATNGYAMEFIGGNAKNYLEFLRYMGQERPGLGSPFQIDIPELIDEDDEQEQRQRQLRLRHEPKRTFVPHLTDDYANDRFQTNNVTSSQAIPIPQGIQPLNPPALNCADSCACADCPARCLSLPQLPDTTSHCHIGALTCGSFFLILAYSILLISFILGIGIRDLWARRHDILSSSSNVLGGNSSKQGRIHLTNSPGEYDRLDMGDRDAEHVDGNHDDDDGLNMTSTIDPSSSRWRRKLSSFMRRSDSDPYHNQSEASSRSTAFQSSSRTGGGTGGRRGDSESNSQRLGRGASLLSPDILASYSQPRTYKLNNILSSGFYKLGLICARNAYITIIIGLVICGTLNAGWAKFAIEKDPVRLWVEKGSELATQKKIFEEEFGPFYRTEQIFLSRKLSDADIKAGQEQKPILDWPTLQWWARIEAEIRSFTSPAGTKLSDVCFAPTADSDDPSQRTAEDCTVQSFMGYFKNTLENVNEETWAKELDYCARTPTACLSSAGQPLNPKLLFGGLSVSRALSQQEKETGLLDMRLDDVSAMQDTFKASQAEAVVITYVLDNSLDPHKVQKAAEWERSFREGTEILSRKAAAERGITVSFSTEVSLEEELNKSTNTDVPIVVLSYLVMFFYVSLSLGGTGEGIVFLVWALILRAFNKLASSVNRRRNRSGPISLGDDANTSYASARSSTSKGSISSALRTIFVDSKFTLGLVGIAIVLLSVSTSVGIFSLCGVKVTLIIAEVIPFLVLAIGVDNVFILLHELQRQNARAYQNVRAITGPGGIHPALLAVGGGASTGYDEEMMEDDEDDGFDESDLPSAEERIARALGRMGPSILLSASCQTVAFGLGAAVGMPAVRNFAIYAAGAVAINALLQITVFVAFMTLDLKRIESSRVDCFPCVKLGSSRDRLFAHQRESVVIRFIRSVYAPFLLKRKVKLGIMALFSGLFVASWICTDYISLGLDQRLALPRKSYLVDYFNDLDEYLQVGPPVYFVEQSLDLTHREAQQQVCGRFSTCSEYSIGNLLEAERKRSTSSYIAEPPSIWLDDFFQWLNPALSSCCRVKKRDPTTFCRPEESEFACKACYEDAENEWNITMEGLPEGEDFMRYLQHWLESPANEDCPLGGKAGYSSAVSISSPSNDDNGKSVVSASHFRTYHTPLKSQSDFINALAQAKRISADLNSKSTNGQGKIFPYSIFYVYFEQYASIVTTTRAVLALALLAVLLVTAVILGSWRTGFVVAITVFMIAMNVLGIMGIWHISLNAISLVNLLISIGIGVEFCSHIARAFMGAGSGGGAGLPHSHPAGEKERDDRAYAALVDVGSSVFSGITMTKLIGISVLALTKSKLLEVYYFRMWLTLIVSGALHGLIFLPVALSFHGGQGFSLFGQEEEEYIAEIARYRGRPFFAADEDEDDEDDDNHSLASEGRY